MPKTSVVTSSTAKTPGRKYKRSCMDMYDVFRVNADGRTYMHTGVRTRPPSGGGSVVSVDGAVLVDSRPKTLSVQNGKDVIGYQSVVVAGSIADGEDGAIISFKDHDVTFLGTARVSLPA